MWKWILVVLAVAGAVLAADLAFHSGEPPVKSAMAADPASNPFPRAVAGVGLVEPRSESVVVGPPEPGRVAEVFVTTGAKVKAGDPLYRLDTTSLEAQRNAVRAAVAVARADLERTKAYRRKTEEPGLVANVASAQAGVAVAEQALIEATANLSEGQVSVIEAQLEAQEEALEAVEKQKEYQRLQTVMTRGAGTSQEEVDQAKVAWDVAVAQQKLAEEKTELAKVEIDAAKAREEQARGRIAQAQAQLQSAQAALDEFRAGPWDLDVAKAQASVDQAQAAVDQLETQIGTMTVRAPIDGTVLRLAVRAGQYVAGGETQAETAGLVLGDVETFHIRVEIDEFDVPALDAKKRAVAYLKTQGSKPVELEFVRVDPYVVPKRSLTNSQTELVDARVLEVVYKITKSDVPLYVGLQMDVYIEE